MYHFNVQVKGRSLGAGSFRAVQKAAYISGKRFHDKKYGETYDSRGKRVAHNEVLAPKGAPKWALDAESLWNEAERREDQHNRRASAQLARDMVIALPTQMSTEMMKECLREFANEHFVENGFAVQIALHESDGHNPHAHIMATMRQIDEGGFVARKPQDYLEKKLKLDQLRKGWADVANHHMERAGIDLKLDHRSFKDQGIDIIPSIKIGTSNQSSAETVTARIAENERIAEQNGKNLIQDCRPLLRLLSRNKAVFNRRSIIRSCHKYSHGDKQFQALMSTVFASEHLVAIRDEREAAELKEGQNEPSLDLRDVQYAFRETIEQERKLLSLGQTLNGNREHFVNHEVLENILKSSDLFELQKQMVRHVCSPKGLAVVEGAAGSGKSRSMNVARQAWEAMGYRVLGGALQGRTARTFQNSSGIQSRSLDSWLCRWERKLDFIDQNSVVCIDEAAMVGTRQMHKVMAQIEKAGAKLVLVQDNQQLTAIEAGAPGRKLAEEHGAFDLHEVHRLKYDWHKDAAKSLRDGEGKRGLDILQGHGCVKMAVDKEGAFDDMLHRYGELRLENPNEAPLMLAYRNVDVHRLNELAREIEVKEGRVAAGGVRLTVSVPVREEESLEEPEGPSWESRDFDFAIGDKILFLHNASIEQGQGTPFEPVLNGDRADILEIGRNALRVRHEDGRVFRFSVRDYDRISHGYASTGHKAQGQGADHVLAYVDKLAERKWTHVAVTRARDEILLYGAKKELGPGGLESVVERSDEKAMALDFKEVTDQNRIMAKAISHENRRILQERENEKLANDIKWLREKIKLLENDKAMERGPMFAAAEWREKRAAQYAEQQMSAREIGQRNNWHRMSDADCAMECLSLQRGGADQRDIQVIKSVMAEKADLVKLEQAGASLENLRGVRGEDWGKALRVIEQDAKYRVEAAELRQKFTTLRFQASQQPAFGSVHAALLSEGRNQRRIDLAKAVLADDGRTARSKIFDSHVQRGLDEVHWQKQEGRVAFLRKYERMEVRAQTPLLDFEGAMDEYREKLRAKILDPLALEFNRIEHDMLKKIKNGLSRDSSGVERCVVELAAIDKLYAQNAAKIAEDLQKPKTIKDVERWQQKVNHEIGQAKRFVDGRVGEKEALVLPRVEIEARNVYDLHSVQELQEKMQELRQSADDPAEFRVMREVLAEKQALNRVFHLDDRLSQAIEGDEQAKDALVKAMPDMKKALQILDDRRLRDYSWEVAPESRRINDLYNRTKSHGIDESVNEARQETLTQHRGRGMKHGL
jgi:Ti-type conjugative transfer relaxase TraA